MAVTGRGAGESRPPFPAISSVCALKCSPPFFLSRLSATEMASSSAVVLV